MNELTFKRLREVNLARSKRWHPGENAPMNLNDWARVTAGKMGEALNFVTDNRELGSSGKPEAALVDHLADVALYLDLFAAAAGIDLASAIQARFNHISRTKGFPERL